MAVSASLNVGDVADELRPARNLRTLTDLEILVGLHHHAVALLGGLGIELIYELCAHGLELGGGRTHHRVGSWLSRVLRCCRRGDRRYLLPCRLLLRCRVLLSSSGKA